MEIKVEKEIRRDVGECRGGGFLCVVGLFLFVAYECGAGDGVWGRDVVGKGGATLGGGVDVDGEATALAVDADFAACYDAGFEHAFAKVLLVEAEEVVHLDVKVVFHVFEGAVVQGSVDGGGVCVAVVEIAFDGYGAWGEDYAVSS